MTVVTMGMPDSSAEPSGLVVESIDAMMGLLVEIIERHNRRGSRLGVYPAVYLEVTRHIARALETPGMFEDPAWVERLDLHFASLYFRALDRFEAGRTAEIPESWRIVLRAAEGDRSTPLHDLMLAINVRLTLDLPLALDHVGLVREHTARRLRDLARVQEIINDDMDGVIDVLERGYGVPLSMLHGFAMRPMQQVMRWVYAQARATALDGAHALARHRGGEARRRLVARLDREAARRGQLILRDPLLGGLRLVRSARRVLAG